MGELAFPVFREALACHRPRFLFSGTADYADADAARREIRRRGSLILGRRLRVLDGRSAESSRGVQARLRRPGNEHTRQQIGRQRRGELEVGYLVIPSFETDGTCCSQETLNDGGVLRQPRITLVVGRQVIECRQIVLETARHYVEIKAAA